MVLLTRYYLPSRFFWECKKTMWLLQLVKQHFEYCLVRLLTKTSIVQNVFNTVKKVNN